MSDEIMQFADKIQDENSISLLLDDRYITETLKRTFNERQLTADGVIARFADSLYAKEFGEGIKGKLKPKVRYVVENSEELHKAVDEGIIKLDKSSDGRTYAQIKNGNKYGKKLGITEESFSQDIDVAQLANALEMKMIEERLAEIIDVMADIGEDVVQILEGQQNDRIGLFYSGMDLFLEAKGIRDETFRKFITANALKTLSDANAQMTQTIQSDIRYLVNREYEKSKGKRLEKINERMTSINKSFEVIYRSCVLKAAIYYEQNEIPAMLTALDEYGKFLKNVIIPNVPQLTEHDINDLYLQDGIWERRANSILNTEKLKKELGAPKVIYLEMEDEENGK